MDDIDALLAQIDLPAKQPAQGEMRAAAAELDELLSGLEDPKPAKAPARSTAPVSASPKLAIARERLRELEEEQKTLRDEIALAEAHARILELEQQNAALHAQLSSVRSDHGSSPSPSPSVSSASDPPAHPPSVYATPAATLSAARKSTKHPACAACGKTAYPLEQIKINELVFHKPCFRCKRCATALSALNVSFSLFVVG